MSGLRTGTNPTGGSCLLLVRVGVSWEGVPGCPNSTGFVIHSFIYSFHTLFLNPCEPSPAPGEGTNTQHLASEVLPLHRGGSQADGSLPTQGVRSAQIEEGTRRGEGPRGHLPEP